MICVMMPKLGQKEMGADASPASEPGQQGKLDGAKHGELAPPSTGLSEQLWASSGASSHPADKKQ